jgi:elongation factor G
VLAVAREHFGRTVFPMTIPLDSGPGFSRVLDVLRNEVVTYKPGSNGTYKEETADGELAERVHELHRQLMEYVAESDDALMEKFFAEGVLGEEELRAGLHKAVQNQVFIPLFAVSAERNVGRRPPHGLHREVRLVARGQGRRARPRRRAGSPPPCRSLSRSRSPMSSRP